MVHIPSFFTRVEIRRLEWFLYTSGSESKVHSFMEKQPANVHWLQNNNNTPQRQQNQLRPGPGNRPNGQSPQRGISPINRWLLVIVLMMLGIFLYQFFNNNSSSNTPPRDELSYSDFYNQINTGNVKSVTIIGTTDITGYFCDAVG